MLYFLSKLNHQIDAEAESCRSSTHQLLELFETAKYKRADAAKFIPTLQQNVMVLVAY